MTAGPDHAVRLTNDGRLAMAVRPTGVRHRAGGDTGIVGFNPYQKHQANTGDIVLVIAALVIVLSLVLWAVLG